MSTEDEWKYGSVGGRAFLRCCYDIVAEWTRRHGQPYRLELIGPAGGSWYSDTTGEEIVMDAADFCRVLAGRSGPDGGQPEWLLATQVPF
jgi:hypothetical protein